MVLLDAPGSGFSSASARSLESKWRSDVESRPGSSGVLGDRAPSTPWWELRLECRSPRVLHTPICHEVGKEIELGLFPFTAGPPEEREQHSNRGLGMLVGRLLQSGQLSSDTGYGLRLDERLGLRGTTGGEELRCDSITAERHQRGRQGDGSTSSPREPLHVRGNFLDDPRRGSCENRFDYRRPSSNVAVDGRPRAVCPAREF